MIAVQGDTGGSAWKAGGASAHALPWMEHWTRGDGSAPSLPPHAGGDFNDNLHNNNEQQIKNPNTKNQNFL